ncbi:rRNA pseudouridine synthase [Candidatus Gracilibacteria bacterium]|nr:rRNA pseudouridine synthase [Candidatus Gracilibacteria bacterium]NUJ98688.1 rRNA pseudouridine synthase [Candidatus Gracilibacteria bacterium]
MRIQKYLSESGICSRRKGEELIEKGLIKINGEIAKIGQSIDPEKDIVEMNEQEIKKQEKLVYYAINKPRGVLTTCAQYGEKNVIDIVDIPERVFPIGRLDKDTTGLLLLTNDGRLANYLMHPRYEHEKEYIVETFGTISDEDLQKMASGVFILGKMTRKTEIKRIASGKFSIILKEGRNRQIRRMVESVGNKVKKLKRIRIENIALGNLDIGQYRPLTSQEISILGDKLGIHLG